MENEIIFKNLEKVIFDSNGNKINLKESNKYIITEKGEGGLNLNNLVIKDSDFLFDHLSKIGNLKSLMMSNTIIKDINGLPKLPKLEILLIFNNESITDFRTIAKCKSITDLLLSGFENIDGIGKLANLKQVGLIDCPNCNLQELQKLEQLESLSLSRTRSLDISKFKKLKELTISECYEEFDLNVLADLTEISLLDLSSNNIQKIDQLNKLSKLKHINLSHNEITDISSLLKLQNIEYLNLTHNKIESLHENILEINLDFSLKPQTIEHKLDILFNITYNEEIKGQKGIFIGNNPLSFPPIEILVDGKSAIKLWFSNQEKRAVNEAKVLFVGEGAVGKTSVMKQLMNLQFDPLEPETKGININDVKVKYGEKDIHLHLWDFGGQEFMHSTHQFFLSRRSLYVLVLDGRKEEKKDYWLKVIEAFGDKSPVVVVMNKIDTNKNFDLNRKFLREKYPHIRDFFRISCATGEGIAELLLGLTRIADEIEMVNTQWIKSWFEIKNKLTAVTHDFISYQQFLEICSEFNIKDDQEQNILIDYLDNLGVLLHFREFDLEDTHILNPQWVTDAVYRIINHEEIALNDGKLQLSLVKDILKQRTESDFIYPIDKQKFIISLMKKFELCFGLDQSTVLIPDLLNIAEPDFELDKSSALKIIFKYDDFLPKSVLPRLMVKMFKDIDLRWRTGVILKNATNNARAIIKTDDDLNIMNIYVDGDYRRDYYSAIRNNLYEINDFYKCGFKEEIPCDCSSCVNNEHPTFYEYNQLRTFQKYGRKEVICDNPPFKPIQIKDLIDDLLNHKPKDLQVGLLKDILWCAREIQQNHTSLLNDENRYNTEFRSLLKAKDYFIEQEAFIGESDGDGNNPGRLDLKISKSSRDLALFEAFKITSFASTGKQYASNHLLKLLKNYNPNGLKFCYAVSYCEMANFEQVWQDYKSSVKDFVFHYEIPKLMMQDLTSEHLNDITDIRLGLTEHSREGQLVKLYHVFMNMNSKTSDQK